MCKNLFRYKTQCREKICEYLFPRMSTYILGQKYWRSNKHCGSTFSQEVLLGCYTGVKGVGINWVCFKNSIAKLTGKLKLKASEKESHFMLDKYPNGWQSCLKFYWLLNNLSDKNLFSSEFFCPIYEIVSQAKMG